MKSLKLIGLALGASLALSTAALAQDITIAVAGPITGSESAFGRQMKNGAEQAVADLNAAGGVLGKQLTIVAEDGASEPTVFAEKAQKLIRSDCVAAVFGGWTSSSRKAMLPVFEGNDAPNARPMSFSDFMRSPRGWLLREVPGRPPGSKVGPIVG